MRQFAFFAAFAFGALAVAGIDTAVAMQVVSALAQ